MPQSERAAILKKLVAWLATQEEGATVPAIVHYVKWEITEGGATDKTVKNYLEDLDRGGIIEYKHPYWKVTPYGRKWFERHSL